MTCMFTTALKTYQSADSIRRAFENIIINFYCTKREGGKEIEREEGREGGREGGRERERRGGDQG